MAFDFDLGPVPLWTPVKFRNVEGQAAQSVTDGFIFIEDLRQAIPPRIYFRSSSDPQIGMGIEILDGVPTCTYLEFLADDSAAVRAKHLRAVNIEEWVRQIVAAVAKEVHPTSKTSARLVGGPATREQLRAIGRRQRRRPDPRNDRELLARVADLYRAHPEAPNRAIAADFGVSERTAARWSDYASDAGLLPKAQRGKKRL